MSEAVTPKRFHEADWRVVRDDASTHFRVGSLAAGVALVNGIGRLADDANHQVDVDLRPKGVTVRLREVALARQISDAARELGVPVDLTGLQIVQIAIDALVIPDVLPFWRAVLGYRKVGDEDLIDPHFQGPPLWSAIAAGGHLVSDENAPGWWTLADAEGNEVDVASWPDRDSSRQVGAGGFGTTDLRLVRAKSTPSMTIGIAVS